MSNGPTILDVAKKVGVSPTTVTHALNGKRPVNDETKKRISEAINELGYVPSYTASHLRNSNSGLIGCYVFDITADFTAYMLRGIESSIKGTGYSLIFASGVDIGYNQDVIIDYFRKYDVEGLLIVNHLSEASAFLPQKNFEGYPVVFLNSENVFFDSIIPNNHEAGVKVAQHMFDIGVRHPAFLGGPFNRVSVQQRLKGFKSQMSKLGILLNDSHILFGEYTYESGLVMVSKLIESGIKFDGIFCANDYIAIGVVARCLKEKIRIPENVKIVGYDDRDVGRYCSIPITTIKQNLEELGLIAFERLLYRIQNKKLPRLIQYCNNELIIRKSTVTVQ